MPEIGQMVSHYRIVEKIGQGGMGEVYLADDTTLDRKVALKFLPEAFTNDPERMARFEREAKLLASLNHPNIAGIHGLEQTDGTRFLVLEYVGGETLQARLSKGSLPLEDALELCRQIAEGLEAAHEKGVIHRDLKPTNVMITAEEKVKILDFGLAKALADETHSVDPSDSPTITAAMTQPGVVLGTAAYMSPEQAKGKSVDKRADIWAFGCILYECLTGKRAFKGEAVTETLAAILRSEPDWEALQPSIPSNIQFVLRRCLEKETKRRFRDAADVRIEIEETESSRDVPSATLSDNRSTRFKIWLLIAGVFILATSTAFLAFRYFTPSVSLVPMHLSVALQSGDVIGTQNIPVAFSPDGRYLAYVSGQSDGIEQLHLRALDNPEARIIPGTDMASSPFFSPDGQWIAFFSKGQLRKVSIAGGAATAICAYGFGAGGCWGPEDTIIFAPSISSGLFHVPATGGSPEPITTLDASKGEISHRYPYYLAGSNAVIFTAMTGLGWDDVDIVIQELDTGEQRTLVRGGHTGRVTPTGQLIYCRAGKIMALPFDLEHNRIKANTPVTIVDGIRLSPSLAGDYSFSNTGSLAYIPASPRQFACRLAWIDFKGETEILPAPPNNYGGPVLSPVSRKIATAISSNTIDLWIYDLDRGGLTRISSEGSSSGPIWTPDGSRVAYLATRGGLRNIFWRTADGVGMEEQLTNSPNQLIPTSWSPDGKDLAFWEVNPETGIDIGILHIEDALSQPATQHGTPGIRILLNTPFLEASPMLSPNGKWLAYVSNKSGRYEVYLLSYPNADKEWPVSTDGGTVPLWAPSGRELFFRSGNKMMAVDIQTEPTVKMGNPRLLFEDASEISDISHDGKRFLATLPVEQERAVTQIPVVLNWFEELKQKVPVN